VGTHSFGFFLPDDSQIEEPMASFFLNQERFDSSQQEEAKIPKTNKNLTIQQQAQGTECY